MLKYSLILVTFIISLNLNAQVDTLPATTPPGTIKLSLQRDPGGEIYKLKPAVDIPLTAFCAGWSLYAFTYIYSKDASSEEEIRNLNEEDIPEFDRWAAGMTDPQADKNSDILFYSSMPYPVVLMLDKEIRRDAAKIAFLYFETMSITGLFYTGTVYFVDRYRPETYNTSIPIERRMGGNFKDSFIGGHPALVATSMFFTAKVYSDYHPESSLKYALFGAAIAGTGITTYLRHIAGKHFPSDLLAGVTIGTLNGILVPHFHKQRQNKNQNIGFFPLYNGKKAGFAFTYKF